MYLILFFVGIIFTREWRNTQNELVGIKLVTAIDKYYSVNRAYPLTQDDLIPEFLDEKPQYYSNLSKKEDFLYAQIKDGNSYEVIFMYEEGKVCYREDQGEWSYPEEYKK